MADYDNFEEMRISGAGDLQQAIQRLEQRKLLLEEDLKMDFHEIVEGLKPVNIIKNTIGEVQQSTDLKHNLIKIALGIGAGYLSGKLVAGKSGSLLKKALGAALQFGVTSLVAKKKDWQDNGNESQKKKGWLKRILSV
ncbi:MAG TPA: hypothetical protein VG847_02710 [Chitinophagaceae bacterium]|nr:hypothetical protein [Chitinophagaceae bacterium]